MCAVVQTLCWAKKDGSVGRLHRFWVVWVLAVLGWSLAGRGAFGEDEAALKSRLVQAALGSAIDDAGLKPWHLKMTIEPGDGGGAATLEEWWAGPERYRVVVTSPKYTAAELRNADGLFRSGDPGQVPERIEQMRSQVVHPMPAVGEIEQAKLDERHESLGKLAVDCVMVGQEIRGVTYPPLGLFPTYCVDKGTAELRLTFDFGSLQLSRLQLGTFQGRSVAIKIGAFEDGKLGATAKVDTLATMPESAMDLDTPAGARKIGADTALVASGVMAGNAISKALPRYPETAKQRHAKGAVVMKATIGRDGHVHSLKLVSYPDGDLAMAAMWAVRQWRYKPYLLNGEATEVETTVTVNFNIG